MCIYIYTVKLGYSELLGTNGFTGDLIKMSLYPRIRYIRVPTKRVLLYL